MFMKAAELIRELLNSIDSGQLGTELEINNDEEIEHLKQVLAFLTPSEPGEYSNTPNEVVAPLSSVTTDAGGGLNGPKHPADIRVKDPRGYE